METPTQDYRRVAHRIPARPLKGLDARVYRLMGAYQRRATVLSEMRAQAEAVDAQSKQWSEMSEHSLQEKLLSFRAEFRRGGKNSQVLLLPALAAIREAAARQVGLRAFPVQLMGALALHRGCLAEMATGEGKTLTAGLAAVMAGWTRRPTHIVTVNDYLVRRDADWLRPLYQFCGIRVGYVTGTMSPADRQKGYACDVTYATSKELLADFLRDRLQLGRLHQPTRRLIRRLLTPRAPRADGLVQRGLHTAIVDEADSVLIDEAVTPLIIASSHRNEVLQEAVAEAQRIVGSLEPDHDYRRNLRYREIELTKGGLEKVRSACGALPGLWRGHERRNELLRQALSAREFFHNGKQYVIDAGKIVIVDEFTGRPMPQRSWREGMHQAIEAKEGLAISDPTETIARLSFQRFFRCFHRLSGMTGTAAEAAGEFWQVYGLPVVRIPTHRPCVRQEFPDRVYAREDAKWEGIAGEVQRIHQTGRPLLVGTRSVTASERLASLLRSRGLPVRLLNAVHLEEEAQIIAQAGEPGHITISTNMAGRGTDIKLGNGVAALGGLHVVATERHESRRVDRQLFGRAARQGDPGSAQAFVSAEDELLQRYVPRGMRTILEHSVRRAAPGHESLAAMCFGWAQRKAQNLAFQQRRAVLRADLWLEEALSFAGGENV